ncbi:aspartate aminotransferase family protein [Humitalea sp. 24SJ18S-53]|uniref:aspartate aminotransferase family protein n=1 Tax=Humitalea sp. 24SJ18S-53 TaxID=3422307 RepID=UPI003D67F8E1
MDQPVAARRNSDLSTLLETVLLEARETYVAARPASAALHQRARAVLPGGNTRSVLFWTPFPTAMAGGSGCMLRDVDGHEYLDLCGEYSAGLFGHSHPAILAAVRGALDGGLNLTGVGANEVALAALLCARFPAMERVRFTNSGTEANLMALTAARARTGRAGVLAFRGGYHGGVLTFPVGAPVQPVNLPLPVTLADYNDGPAAAALLAAGDIGAVIVEPMLGAGGCIPATPEFLGALRAACDGSGAVLIFDEVMTSRHAAGGLQARLGVTPDLMTLGKYVAGGMSFGAFGGRADIMDQFDGHRPGSLPHAGTFNNNVLSMAAGLVAMGEVFSPAAAEALWARGEVLRTRLNDAARAAGVAVTVTGAGSMLTPNFRDGPIDRPAPSDPIEEQRRELFFLDMLAAGIYIARRGMVALSLPVGDAEMDRFVAAFAAFCRDRAPLLQAG